MGRGDGVEGGGLIKKKYVTTVCFLLETTVYFLHGTAHLFEVSIAVVGQVARGGVSWLQKSLGLG